MNELKYMLATFKEALRLHNIASTFRAGAPNYKFELDGISYPTEGFMV
jgi:hypothetical protein